MRANARWVRQTVGMAPRLSRLQPDTSNPELDQRLPIPFGRRLELPGRGTTFVREVEGPAGAPTVLLLHGWLATGGLNWFQAFAPLAEHFNVVAVDMRGHGRGIRSSRRVSLADCADDAAATITQLGCGPVIAVGYSLGGEVAQLLWKRHRALVEGLVLCSTGQSMMPGWRQQLIFSMAMAAIAGTTRLGELAAQVPSEWIRSQLPVAAHRARPTHFSRWAAAEMGRHDRRMVIEAAVAMSNFSSRKWTGKIDVPTSVVVTTRDRGVSPVAQLRLALAIPGSSIFRFDDGHLACMKAAYGATVVEACLEVADRIPGADREVSPAS